ncbi:MAG TPA: type VI secretion system baseplate subunit TssF [Acetobacteraceae bacterium]|nr:type VI secretion system baseplate subunit TssF [Acetobacteraceae bacterium]
MSEALLPYFNRELAALRKEAGEFADAYPRVAPRLRLTPDGQVDDPFVERVLEGVAFLAARVQHRLDDDLPELTDVLLEMLSPHLLAPVPSMTTLQLSPPPEIAGRIEVAKGLLVETEPVRGEPVRFSTAHPVTLWPLSIDQAKLMGLPLTAPANPRAHGAMACLRIVLRTREASMPIAPLGLDRLRLHLRGAGVEATALYELLCTSTLSIALADGPMDPNPTILGPEALVPAGLEPHEAALPWPLRAFAGHRLLTEYFAFPDKFLYVDLEGLDARSRGQAGDRLEIFIYLSRNVPDLERSVTAANLGLFCTPAINLFPQRCESIHLDGSLSEWPLIADSRRPTALEIYAVEGVRESRADGGRRAVLPFYRIGRSEGDDAEITPFNYIALRRPAPLPLTGTQTTLMLRDAAFDPALPAEGILSVDAICCNRDLPAMLPFGGGQPRLRIAEGTAPVSHIECLTAPTPTLRPELQQRSAWKLLSHLALNHLSIVEGESGATALREILRLHDLRETAETRAALGSLLSAETRPGIARLPGGRPGTFARGLDVTLTFDAQGWAAGGLYLLAAVLSRFLSLQVSVNAFVRTEAALRGRAGRVARFPPRSGTRSLL